MIVGTDSPKIIGKRYDGAITDAERRWQRIPFVVLREATREEWEAEIRESPHLPERAEQDIALASSRAWFYEVSVD